MRITKYGSDVELRIQFPNGNSGITSGNVTTTLYKVVDSSGGSGTETTINLTGLTGWSEVSSTGIYRLNIDSSAFSTNPSGVTEPVLVYGSVSESQYGTSVNIPMFEVTQLGEDDLQAEILGLNADLNQEIQTAFSAKSATPTTLAEALAEIWDDTDANAGNIWDEALSGSAHNTTGTTGRRLFDLSETWASGGTNETLLSAVHTRLGQSSDSGSTTGFGLLNAIVADTTVIGTPAGASVSADIASLQTDTDDIQVKLVAVQADTDDIQVKIGAPAGSSMSADIASLQVDTDDIQVKLGSPAGSNMSADIASVQADTDDIQVKLGTPAGSNMSADIASVQADTDDLQSTLGTPAVNVSSDIASNKVDLTTLLSRLGSIGSASSLGGDLFGAVKYLASQAQITQGGITAPARASVEFPSHVLAPQGVSAKYLKLKVLNRNNQGQLERPRALGDAGVEINGKITFLGVTLGTSENGSSLAITVNGSTETWYFYDSQQNPSFTSGLQSTGTGYFVYNSGSSDTALEFMQATGLGVLQTGSELASHFEFDDANSPAMLVSPKDYSAGAGSPSKTVAFAYNVASGATILSTVEGLPVAGSSQMFLRVLVDGVATTGRLFKDDAGNTGADASNNANSTVDGNLSKSSPVATYFAMIGGDSLGQFELFYKVSAGQTENVSFEIFGQDKNKVLDSLGTGVPDNYIESDIIAVHHTTVQTQSLAGMGIAF